VSRSGYAFILAAASIALGAGSASAGSSPACRTSDLRVRQVFSSGAAGHVVHVFRVRNVSSATCHTFGYFGVRLLGKRGRKLPTRARRVTHDVAGAQPRQRVTLRPGHAGSFRISTATGAGYHCVDATGIQVIAPDDTERATVKFRRARLDIVACQHGRIFVAPIQPGNGAKPR
jgi:Protein of unknown function (DUF4232)